MEKEMIKKYFLGKKVCIFFSNENGNFVSNGDIKEVSSEHLIIDDKFKGLMTIPLCEISNIELRPLGKGW